MDENEKAALDAKIVEQQAALEGKDTVISEKDTEIASLQEKNTQLAEELATLKAANTARDQEELANKRLAELTAIDGFKVSDEEKASLVETLKSEDSVAFENRVLKAKIVSIEASKEKAKVQQDEEDASLIVAAARGDLDIFPSAGGKDDKGGDIYSIM